MLLKFNSVSSVAQLCQTLCNPMDSSTPDFPVLHQLSELAQLLSVESVMPSSHLVICLPSLLLPSILTNIRVFSNESALCIRWPKYWSLSFSISPFNEYSGLFSLELIGLISLLSKELSRVFSNTRVQNHHFFGAQPFLWSSSHFCK